MVAGKVKKAVGLQKSPSNSKPNISPNPPPLPPPSSGKIPQKGAVFSRSFGVYFPRASAQVQPRPPDVTELLSLVERLRERESLLKTELLEHKLMKESVAILPVLENEIASRDAEIQRNANKIECLEAENERLREDLEVIHMKASEEKKEHEKKLKALEDEIKELKKARAESKRFVNADFVESDEMLLSQRFQIQGLLDASVKSNLIKSLKKGVKASHEIQNKRNEAVDVDNCVNHLSFNKINEDFEMKTDEFVAEIAENLSRRSRAPRVPKPPPRPASSSLSSSSSSSHSSLSIAAERILNEDQPAVPAKTMPPPAPLSSKAVPAPPPPPPKGMKNLPAKVKRVPEVVEFYHSLMRRDSRRDPGGGATDAPAVNARDMIGEIENRSAHLLAIKTDVETQGDFIGFLIKEVEDAAFRDIEDVVPFVKWLDDELSYLVDERAVLKHFNWPEQKADALREAAFGYCDLKKLESEASSFRDNQRQPCAPALKKMQSLFEKLEHGVHNLLRVRESATKRYNLLHIPTDWMLETGYICQIKLASVKLALKYMKRVSAELEIVGGYPEEEELIVQGVRFAFRVHQFAGGFDVETMKAFQELRDKARSCHIQCQNQQQHKYICRSTPC